ncbi:MAG TPA: hypothetical protein EYP10_12145 [Armatimonadetes bacterium]|nr:hypothetical protein [Armatimonadota bacterium]
MKINAFDRSIDLPRTNNSAQDVDAVSSLPAEISRSGRWQWYQAALPLGEVSIALWPTERFSSLEKSPIAESDKRLLDAACVLGRDEELLEALEEWLGSPLDLEPVESSVQIDAQIMVIPRNHGLNRWEGCALLAISLELLRHLEAPPPKLQEHYDLRWGGVPCRLMLSRMGILEEQLCDLETGSLLLLPASFESRWRCSVIPEDDPVLQAAPFLEVKENILEFVSVLEIEPAAVEASAIEVFCVESVTVSLDWLLGWSSSPRTLFLHLLSICAVDVFQKGDLIARGDLLPVGRGYGVYIQERQEIA